MNNKIILAFIVGMVLAITVSVLWGCRKTYDLDEHFAPHNKSNKGNKDKDKSNDKDKYKLSVKERELFEDLKANKLNDDQIQKLINAGILNSYLFEKFLYILGIEDSKKSKVEHFTSSSYDDNKKENHKKEYFTPAWKSKPLYK